MFGYVTPDKPELKIWEYEVFRGYYCGVCKTIGKEAGHRARLVLSFDSAFLALLLDSLHKEPLSGKQKRCPIHPITKRFMVNTSPALKYASDINILLSYYSLKDKWLDERNLVGPSGMLLLNRGFQRIKWKYPELLKELEEELALLHRMEQNLCQNIDEASEPFARMMQKIFQYKADNDTDSKALGWMGYNLGKWIYLLDAYDDIEENIKSGAYNPLLVQFQYRKEEKIQSFRERIQEKTEFILIYSLSEMEKAFSLLEVQKNRSILENIVYSGLLVKTRNVLEMGADCHEKSI